MKLGGTHRGDKYAVTLLIWQLHQSVASFAVPLRDYELVFGVSLGLNVVVSMLRHGIAPFLENVHRCVVKTASSGCPCRSLGGVWDDSVFRAQKVAIVHGKTPFSFSCIQFTSTEQLLTYPRPVSRHG